MYHNTEHAEVLLSEKAYVYNSVGQFYDRTSMVEFTMTLPFLFYSYYRITYSNRLH